MKTKVCAWCEGSPKGTPCKMARELHGDISSDLKDEKGNYLQHLAECNINIMPSCSEETKKKWNSLKA